MKHVYAHTSSTYPYPDYVSVSADDRLEICSVAVRSPGESAAGQTRITRDQALEMAEKILEVFGAVSGQAYGIIDPDYARVFSMARCLAWAEGYAIAFNGSFTRDLDLIAVPWTDSACEPEHLMRRIEQAAGLKNITPEPGDKPHGRKAWTLVFPGFGDPRFVDLSVMPRNGAT